MTNFFLNKQNKYSNFSYLFFAQAKSLFAYDSLIRHFVGVRDSRSLCHGQGAFEDRFLFLPGAVNTVSRLGDPPVLPVPGVGEEDMVRGGQARLGSL